MFYYVSNTSAISAAYSESPPVGSEDFILSDNTIFLLSDGTPFQLVEV